MAARVIEDFREVEVLFARMFPGLTPKRPVHLRIFVFKNWATMRRFAPLYEGKPEEISGTYLRDPEGSLILGRGRIYGARNMVYHEYMHFLISRTGVELPAWLSEGLAELYATIDIGKAEVGIGRADLWNASYLRERRLIPLQRLFEITRESPEYNSEKHGRGIFYAQSWALVHYLVFGETDLPDGAFVKLVESVENEPVVSEETFRESTSLTFEEAEERLRRYIHGGEYQMRAMQRPALPTAGTVAFKPVSETEANLIDGMLLLAVRGSQEAEASLKFAYQNLPNSAKAAAYLGYLRYEQGLYAAAVEAFEEAIERGSETAAPHLYYVAAILRRDNPDGIVGRRILSAEETLGLLQSLFSARELGERRRALYHCLGEVWLNSQVTAKERQIAVVAEGLRWHGDDELIGYYLARLLVRIERYEEARMVIRGFLKKGIPDEGRRRFEELDGKIERGVESSLG